ncbi:MAG: hypothetical protein NTX33_16360 [Propionibacteriales bacterium]|nr:hypothetical protein [Propionibacteriales bacterium]
MAKIERNWLVSLEPLWATGDDDEVTSIEDVDRGIRYEVLLASAPGKPQIRGLAIMPLEEGGVIDQTVLDKIPLQRLANTAAAYRTEAGLPRPAVLTPQAWLPGERPTPEMVAELWRAGTNRELMAREFFVSPKTADKWIRDARDRGLIPPARTGRPRDTSTPKSSS